MRFVSTLAAVAFVSASVASGAALAVTVQLDKEIAAAATHAGLAAQEAELGGVHMHLQHTMNCLVGPKGEGYSAKDMDPCSALGNGAIVDAVAPDTVLGVNTAIAGTRKGLAEQDLTKAKEIAAEVNKQLLSVK